MTSPRILRRLGIWLAAVALVCSGVAAIAQAEPTLNQVYEAAQAGRLADAQVMMQQVLVAHPDSAKAHFVDAEVAARAGKLQRARESLARAEKLAPGLPFAKPAAVASLRAELAGARSVTPRGASGLTSPSVQQPRTDATAPASASSFPLGLGLALGGGAIALVFLLLRRKSTPPPMAPNSYGDRGPLNGGLTGPQAFGGGGGVAAPMGYGQPGYGQPGYGQAPGTGMGSRVMGGLATGMAVGAGVLAAEAIGRNLMGSDEHRHAADSANTAANNDYLPLADTNADMGGQNFGVNDAGSWDDGGALSGGDVGGGGDWDS
ncbi:MAG: uncharacterized protein JWQ33_2162 [Ramlibacter sp.]|nr:uncharacterized protein [Ramlibacter sp.]